MRDLETLLAVYQQMIGLPLDGDRDFDGRLWQLLCGQGEPPRLTSIIDDADNFLHAAMPGWHVHYVQANQDRIDCRICRIGHADEFASGQGRTIPLAILSAAVTGMLTKIVENSR